MVTVNNFFSEDDANLIERDDGIGSMRFYITAGVINRAKIVSFERMLWRISKGEQTGLGPSAKMRVPKYS